MFVRMAVSHAVHLLERESELAELAGGIAGARTGAGRLVLVEGPAGIGKTELLTAARSLGDEAGLVVASARGSELEHGFAFGVVRQLFEPVLRLCSPAQKSQLLTGQARLAAGVLGVGVGGSTRRGSGLPDVLQGLYWLTLNLAERARLLVVIDDAHWADRSSLRFISYLAGRLDEAGVLAVLAVRSDERADDDLLAAVARERTSRVMGLRPLSEDATGQLIAGEYHEEGEPEFVQACRAATGGNPFFLRELLRALRADGIPPTAAEVERVAGQGPASVARSVLTRIGGLSRAAGDVAQALSVLGGEAGLREITWVCSLDEELVVAAVDDLARAGIVVGPTRWCSRIRSCRLPSTRISRPVSALPRTCGRRDLSHAPARRRSEWPRTCSSPGRPATNGPWGCCAKPPSKRYPAVLPMARRRICTVRSPRPRPTVIEGAFWHCSAGPSISPTSLERAVIWSKR